MVPIGLAASSQPRESALRFVEKADNAKRFVMGIFDKAEGAIIGFRALDYFPPNRRIILDSVLDPAYQGRRISYELHEVFYDFLFYGLGAHKVMAHIFSDNARGRRVTEKAGYRLEGVLRHDVLSSNLGWRDVALYGLLESDWRALRTSAKPQKGSQNLIGQGAHETRVSWFPVTEALNVRR